MGRVLSQQKEKGKDYHEETVEGSQQFLSTFCHSFRFPLVCYILAHKYAIYRQQITSTFLRTNTKMGRFMMHLPGRSFSEKAAC